MTTPSAPTLVEKAVDAAVDAAKEARDLIGPKMADALQQAAERLTPDTTRDTAAAMLSAEAGDAPASTRRRWPLALIGLGLGAAAAMTARVVRQRRQRAEEMEWPAYEPPARVEPERVESVVEQAKESVAEVTDITDQATRPRTRKGTG